MNSISEDLEQRKQAEIKKALEKYGEEAFKGGGVPGYDVLDYLINEVVGLDRYGEMIQYRAVNEWPESYKDAALAYGQTCREFSRTMAVKLIALRLSMLEAGVLDDKTGEER